MRINTTTTDHLPEEFTVESLREGGLTDQEIEALASGDDPLLTIPDPETPVQAQTAPDGDGVGTPPATPAAMPVATMDDLPITAPPPPEIPEIPNTAAAEARVNEIDKELDALADRYDNGDLTRAEFLAQQKALVSEQAKATALISNAEEAANRARAAIVKHWEDTLDAYKGLAPGLFSEAHLNRWDHHLRAVTGNAAFADMSRLQQIRLAHANYDAEVKARTGKGLDGDAAIPSAKAANAASRKVALRDDDPPPAPTTLAGLNSDRTDEIEDSAFAVMDREIMKDPLRAEAMFARLSPEQQERYLNEV